MHKLDRSNVATPACLTGTAYVNKEWGDLTPEDKRDIRRALVAMQHLPGPAGETIARCAYCEIAVSDPNPPNNDSPVSPEERSSIEHFRAKAAHPALTFSWSNLFLCCSTQGLGLRCEKAKDDAGTDIYSPDDLLKPDDDDPEHYLQFSSNGTIAPRPGQTEQAKKRALETIRVLKLDHDHLTALRKAAIEQVKQRVDIALSPNTTADPDLLDEMYAEFIDRELNATAHLAFATAIKHALQQ